MVCVSFEQCDDLENDTYSDLIEIEKDDNYIDYIASLIDTYFETSFPEETKRFRITYSLEDLSGNSNSVQPESLNYADKTVFIHI